MIGILRKYQKTIAFQTLSTNIRGQVIENYSPFSIPHYH